MKALVTGGAGFIGSHLVDKLVERGHEVIVIDDLSNGDVHNLDSVISKIEFVERSILDYGLLSYLVAKADVVFHLATRCLVQGLENPQTMHEVNDIGTVNVCFACKERNRKLVYIGSSEEYGNQTQYPIKETNPLNPISIYGLTKAIGEEYVHFFHKIYHVPTVVIRPFNVYGPRHREDNYAAVITKFIKRLQEGKPPIIHGDGQQTRDFTYISDIIEGIILLSTLEKGEVVNLGSGVHVSILNLAYLIQEAWNSKAPQMKPLFEPARPNDVRHLVADITLAQKYGYKLKIPFKEGLKMYVAWYKEKEGIA